MTPQWVQMMARYNAWQNGWVVETASGLSDGERKLDRGAFFGSIHRTLNHLLWADLMWMSRFDSGIGPACGGTQSAELFADWEPYRLNRAETDARIEGWAKSLTPEDCTGEISWWSGVMEQEITRSKEMIFTHFFNHQIHHRGQVHAMLTAAGASTPDTDLIFME